MSTRGTVTDSNGREVTLTDPRWRIIIAHHPELHPHRQDVLRAVKAPDRQKQGRLANQCHYYLETQHPSHWLKVIVSYKEGHGEILCAYARRSDP